MSLEKIKIGLIGFGCVNTGLYQILTASEGHSFEVKKIAVKHPGKPRILREDYFVYDPKEIIEDKEITIIAEAIDDAKAAYELVKLSLLRGKSVITANKKMLAFHVDELLQIAESQNVSLLYEASSCGVIPIVHLLDGYFRKEPVNSIRGIFNGTSNFILSKIFQENYDYNLALAIAQKSGYAESNPFNDVSGLDAKYKLVLLIRFAFGASFTPESIVNVGIDNINAEDVKHARSLKSKIKLVAYAGKTEDGVAAFVLPQFVRTNDFLHNVEEENNAVEVDLPYSSKQFYFGKGAGSFPTGSAMYKNLLAAAAGERYHCDKLNIQKVVQSDLLVEIYLRYHSEALRKKIQFVSITEGLIEENYNYVVGQVSLQEIKRNMTAILDDKASLIFTGKTNKAKDLTGAKNASGQFALKINPGEVRAL